MFLLGCFLSAEESDVKVIKDPFPVCAGLSTAKEIIYERSIEEVSDNNIRAFTGIQSIAIDGDGNYYALDYKHATVIKLSPEFKFLKSIGRRGEGPGEFRLMDMTINKISIGLDKNLYVVNRMTGRISKFSLEGVFLTEYKYEQFIPFKLIVDEKGDMIIPSVKGYIFDIHDSKMNYKKSLLPESDLKTFLFFKPPACVIYRYAKPGIYVIDYDWLSTKELVIANRYDISITILNPRTGKILKKFYAWDDYILSEFKKKIKRSVDSIGGELTCTYSSSFYSFFIDRCDNIYLQFVDFQNNHYLYSFSRSGRLNQVYLINTSGLNDLPLFFQFKDDKFYGHTTYGIHIFKEKKEVKSY